MPVGSSSTSLSASDAASTRSQKQRTSLGKIRSSGPSPRSRSRAAQHVVVLAEHPGLDEHRLRLDMIYLSCMLLHAVALLLKANVASCL